MTVEHFRNHLRAHEKAIADGLVDVATELRLADAAELILLVRNNQDANIADLVNSSTELYFKPGSLRYALSAGASVRWDAAPTIALDMEFRHASVCVFFRLMLGQSRAGVEIIDMIFDETDLEPPTKTQRLVEAIADARVPVKRARVG
jgi:hypothetical protein